MSKALVCPCEDVSVDEVHKALAKGFCDMESVKRFTGFGTGVCQGKQCLPAVGALLAAHSPETTVSPFTTRTPLLPTELATLASAKLSPAPDAPLPFEEESVSMRPPGPLEGRAQVVIVGGGIMGLALAHELARRGQTDVVVLEKGYLCAGASGRNGGGVRMQWGTPTMIQLAKRSIELMRTFARDMGINIWLRQGGYLFLAKSPAVAARLERSARLHHQQGVNTELLSPQGALDIVPQLSLKGVVSAAYNKEDGVVFPWPFLWGYAQTARKKGVRVETFTEVTGFEVSEGRVVRVKTSRGDIACDTVVLAAGAFSPSIAQMMGLSLPNKPHRHEILSTEPLKPFLKPLVSVLDSGLYFSQSMRGEIVGGMGDPEDAAGLHLGSSLRFLSRFSNALLEQMPRLGSVKVLRQWAGPYDVTPDNSPILGHTPGFQNVLQMSGFVGHGFMTAPAVAERMAQWMVSGESDDLFERFNLSRFAQGRLEKEDMIIG